MQLDFTLKKYEQLCRSILAAGLRTSTISEFLLSATDHEGAVIFRHDVDRSPLQALSMAQVENKCGIRSTYYFRTKTSVFRTDIIQKINQLGHEIGYHYETLAECKGNYKDAMALFIKELNMFREICPVTSISMHGRPLSKYDNRDLWQKYDFLDHELLGECYLSIDYNHVLYLSDTGRTWHPTRFNIRDKVDGQGLPELEKTDELIQFIGAGINKPLCLLTHPNRWTDSPLMWGKEWLLDQCVNRIKQLLIWVRR